MLVSSCYKEVELPPDTGEVFELSVTPEMQEFIYNSRDTSYTIAEAGMLLFLDDQPLDLDEISTRGKSALQFQRKSYTVKLNRPITITGPGDAKLRRLTRFKLIAMAMDFTYIESRIGFGILESQDIMPLFYRFVEFKINGQTQGVYLLVEDPEQYYKEQGSEYILRRGYHHRIDDAAYKPNSHYISLGDYETRFREIYSILTELRGEDLYDALNQRLDLEQYFRKIGIDYLLQNGDYTDEIYLYSSIVQDEIRFSIIPWDYDDLFRGYPHEVGVSWGTGKLFGDRNYETHQDILDVIGNKMIFSIEDDLDYTIAMDPYLYSRYESTLATMIEKMKPEDFDVLFEQVYAELAPYYYREEVIEQSQYDGRETSMNIWMDNMAEKKAFLKERLGVMKDQL